MAQPTEVSLRIVHDGAFGQLDHKVSRLEPRLIERLSDILHQVPVLQVAAGDIHSDAQSRSARYGTAPGVQFTTGLPQHPAPELDDLTALLRHLDEAGGHQHPEFRMPPAHQRLDAEEAARAEVDYGLILDEELLIDEGAADIRLQTQSFLQHLLHSAAER